MKQQAERVRVGVIGLGWAGVRQSEAVVKSSMAELCAAADLSEERRREYAERFPGVRLYAGLEELLDDPGIDAVVVCLPNFLHFPVSLAALRRGRHVLCEKPPALNSVEMRMIREEAENRSLVYGFGRQMRFTDSVRRAREMISEGRLGEVYFARSTWVRARGIPVGAGGWFLDKEKAGGGAMIDIGIHALDSAWHLMGNPKPLTVTASVSTRFGHLVPGGMKYDVDDSGFAFIRFGNGAALHLGVSWAGNLEDGVSLNKQGEREEISTLIYGDRASLRLDPLTLFEDCGGKLTDIAFETGGGRGFREQMENFVGAVLGEEAILNSADHAVDLMEMLDAIYESAARGREIVMGERLEREFPGVAMAGQGERGS